MTINYPIKTMWRSFFCALVATVVLSVSLSHRKPWNLIADADLFIVRL